MAMNSDIGRPWAESEVRSSALVFIGRQLPNARLLDALAGCLVPVPASRLATQVPTSVRPRLGDQVLEQLL